MSRVDDLIAQGRQLFNQGNYQKAIPRFEEAMVQARTSGNERNELNALDGLCVCWENLGNYQKFLEVATHLLARARTSQDKHYEMVAILRLAEAIADLSLRERWSELKLLLLEGLALARHLNSRFSECYFLLRLGSRAVSVGEYEQGFSRLQEALNTIRSNMENQHYIYFETYCALSKLIRKREQDSGAIHYAEMAIELAQKHGNPSFIAEAYLCLAYAELAQGERAEALRLIAQVLPQAREYGWKKSELDAFYLKGEAEQELGHLQEAEASARRALALAQEMKMREEEVESLLSLGKALLALKRREEARDILAQTRRLSQERNYDNHFHEAEHLLQGAV